MANREPFQIGEWYHCYNRGVDKRIVFHDSNDYERFLISLYLGNSKRSIHFSNLKDATLQSVLVDEAIEREPLVSVGAFALMPNHFHLILHEIEDGGIARFMQKVFTAYTMYFNKRYDRTGALFAGTCKSKHLESEIYLKHAIAYTQLNPAELFDPTWKQGIANISKVEYGLKNYPYVSFLDGVEVEPVSRRILGTEVFELYDEPPSFHEMIADAAEYYAQANIKV